MKKNKEWFGIIIAILIVILISLLAISILDYIVPFSRNTKGIEHSVWAYYQANSGIEEALFHMSEESYEVWDEFSTSLVWTVSSNFSIVATGSRLPPIGNGNSEFDTDWNKIRVWEPIQLELGKWMLDIVDWSNISFYFRVPDLDNLASTAETLSWASIPIITWSLSANNTTINAAGTYVDANDICNSKDSCSAIDFSSKQWVDLDGSETSNERIENFYGIQCDTLSERCTLKLSVINTLETIAGTSVPYIEWYIDFGSKTVPLRHAVVETQWRTYGFRKDLEVSVPQQTVSEAFDFTVFQ